MPDRDGPGHDFAVEEIEDRLRRLPLFGQWQGHQAMANIAGHDAIDRLRGQAAEVFAEHPDGARAEVIEIRPVLDEGMHRLLGHEDLGRE